MKNSAGDPGFPIWLIGDSPPEKWADKLDSPLDPKHPARHNIWTSIADSMQDRLYRKGRLRLDTSRLYIRNATNQPLTTSTIEAQTQLSQKILQEFTGHRSEAMTERYDRPALEDRLKKLAGARELIQGVWE